MAVAIDGRASGGVSAVRIVEHALASLVDRLDPDAVALRDVTDLWCAYDSVERLAANAKTLLAARVEESADWKRAGARSAADHLATLGGTSPGVARRALSTLKDVTESPVLADAMRTGTVSAAQAEAIASAAAADPSATGRLIDLAGTTNVRELREECLRTKVAADPDRDATYERIRRNRHLRTSCDAEGAWQLWASGTADAGARFEAGLAPIIDAMFDNARAEGRNELRDAYAFDALMSLIDRDEPADGKKRSPKARYTALLHIDVEALVRGHADGEETCELPGYGPIPVRVARDLLGESILKLVMTQGVDVMHVTHLGRGATAAQRIALLWSKPKCANAACSSMFVQIDRRDPWATTRHTKLKKLDPLCPHDHDLKTHHGWSLIDGEGRRAFVPPDDPRHPRNRPPP